MSKTLTKAFEKRQFSDYEYTFVITREDAEEMLKEGKIFIASVVLYLKSKKRMD